MVFQTGQPFQVAAILDSYVLVLFLNGQDLSYSCNHGPNHYNGDLQLFPGVDQIPHLEVPYPLSNGGQQLRHARGRCPVRHHSVTLICVVSLKRATLRCF